MLWLERNCRISVAPGVHFLKWFTSFVTIKIDYIKDMNGILLVPQQCCNEIWISISPLSAWNFRGSRYLMQGPIIASHSIPWDARWLRHAWDTCFWWQSFYLVLFVCYSLECFSINHHIFLWESGDRADTSLTLILSYRHGNAHYNKKLQLRRSHDRSKFIMETPKAPYM